MNRKNIGVIIPILIVVELSFLFLTCMSYSNKDVDKIKEVYKVDKKMFAMYVINESTGKYDEIKNSDSFPSGNYKINKNKSTCVDNKGNSVTTDIMTYNNNKLTVTSNKTVFCYLYFDIKADITVTISTDGVTGVLPTNGVYKNTVSCDSATAIYNQKYQRLEFSSVTSDEVKCNLDYIKDTTTYPTLKSIVESKAPEVDDAEKIANDATYAKLVESEYATITNTSTYPFVWDGANSQWVHSATVARSSSYFKYYPSETGGYQVCYTLPSSARTSSSSTYKNYIGIYLNSTTSVKTTVYSNYNSGETKTGCYDLGYLTPSDYIYIRGYYYDNNISFYIQKSTDIESVDVGYRYTGKQPDNWVWFNNEMWRIIGSVPVCMNADCSTKENLVKIIRADSIGGLAFNSANSNTTWGSNTLYTLLNTKYYGKLDATGASPCLGNSTNGYALCNYTENGISSDTGDYYSRMIKDVYWNVGTVSSISTTIVDSYILETATISSVSGRIGLMNASDYGYASGQTRVALSSLNGYEQTNWLYGQGGECTLTPSSTSTLLYVNNDNYEGASVRISSGANYGRAVRPVLYLDSTVYVINGEEENAGSISNPYQIAK